MRRATTLLFALSFAGCLPTVFTGGSCPEPPDLTPSGRYTGIDGRALVVDGDTLDLRDADGNVRRYRIENVQQWGNWYRSCGPRPEAQPLRRIRVSDSSTMQRGELLVTTRDGVKFFADRMSVGSGEPMLSADRSTLTIGFPNGFVDGAQLSATWTFETADGTLVDESLLLTISASEYGVAILDSDCL